MTPKASGFPPWSFRCHPSAMFYFLRRVLTLLNHKVHFAVLRFYVRDRKLFLLFSQFLPLIPDSQHRASLLCPWLNHIPQLRRQLLSSDCASGSVNSRCYCSGLSCRIGAALLWFASQLNLSPDFWLCARISSFPPRVHLRGLGSSLSSPCHSLQHCRIWPQQVWKLTRW